MEFNRFVVFFKQKTAYEVRISDWSSDVCSSDLNQPIRPIATASPSAGTRRSGPFKNLHSYNRTANLAGAQGEGVAKRHAGVGRLCGDRTSTRLNSSH